MEELLVMLPRQLLIVVAELVIAKLLHYLWSRMIAVPAA
jgi:hypothetical protein